MESAKVLQQHSSPIDLPKGRTQVKNNTSQDAKALRKRIVPLWTVHHDDFCTAAGVGLIVVVVARQSSGLTVTTS
jgi:hypothetical protein